MNEPSWPAMGPLLEKAAVDNGFELPLQAANGWIGFASTRCPLRIWLRISPGGLLAAFSRQDVTRALAEFGPRGTDTLPAGATGGLAVGDVPTLHRLLRRAFQLGRTLPDELLRAFEKQTEALPRATEAERVVVQRVGQDIFRQGLIEFWDGRCAITGLAVPELLRASHIKAWAACETDAERLDVFNGLLLAAHLDAAFDQGFITVSDDGQVAVSRALDMASRECLSLAVARRITLADGHRQYLAWHRERVFRRTP
jgi:putative restriction endonuclease